MVICLSFQTSNSVSYTVLRSTPRSKGRLTTAGSGSSSPAPLLFSMSSDLILEDGMSVFANKEMGIIRFIGETEFAPGSIWLGVELRKPSE